MALDSLVVVLKMTSLADVSISTPADTDVLQYNSSQAKWTNRSSIVLGGAGANTTISNTAVNIIGSFSNANISSSSMTIGDISNNNSISNTSISSRFTMSGNTVISGSSITQNYSTFGNSTITYNSIALYDMTGSRRFNIDSANGFMVTNTSSFANSYLSPTLLKVQDVVINPNGITNGQILAFNGSQMVPVNAQITIIDNKIMSHSLVLSDAGKTIEMNTSTASNITVPANSSHPFTVGTQINVIQMGSGQVTITPAANVTIRSEGNKLKTKGQYAAFTLIKRASDEWYAVGNLTT